MRDENDYTEIYTCGPRHLYVLKDDGRYSFLERKNDSRESKMYYVYTEIIVAAEPLENVLEDIPSSYETKDISKIRLLFGNFDGLQYFADFCDENDIETKTFVWEIPQ